MKLMRKTIALLIAVLMLCAISMPALGEPGEQQSPGLDVVIVMDFSSSTFPGLPGEHADGEFMSLDAAAMLINMCDSEFSNVAVVPFTQGAEYWKEFNKSQNADLWYNWIDMSDMDRRSALCDSLFETWFSRPRPWMELKTIRCETAGRIMNTPCAKPIT